MRIHGSNYFTAFAGPIEEGLWLLEQALIYFRLFLEMNITFKCRTFVTIETPQRDRLLIPIAISKIEQQMSFELRVASQQLVFLVTWVGGGGGGRAASM